MNLHFYEIVLVIQILLRNKTTKSFLLQIVHGDVQLSRHGDVLYNMTAQDFIVVYIQRL